MEDDFLKKLAEGFSFFAKLSDDVTSAKKILDSNDSQFSRRMYLRSLFALIEGNSFRLRQMALAAHKHRGKCLSDDEVIVLKEKEINVTENGKLKVRTKHLEFIANVRFSQNCFLKAIGGKQPDYSDNGWALLKNAVKIRNRITHPRSEEDLIITDDELVLIDKAKEWYSNNVQYLLI